MNVLFENIFWMNFNIYLAIIPVFLGWWLVIIKNSTFKWVIGIIWFLYLPNTIYIFTDLSHILDDWGKVNSIEKLVLILQYGILEFLGFLTFILALYPFEKILLRSRKFNKNNLSYYILIILNFMIGFGVVLGRVERINSWYVLTRTQDVINATLHIFQTPQLLYLVILFGIFANCFYFLFRKAIIVYFSFDK